MAGRHSKSGFDRRIGNILLVIFILFTALVRFVDVRPIGPEGSSVGFAGVNGAAAESLPFNAAWYGAAEGIGYAALLVCAGFALQGLWQLIKGKSLKAVDPGILALGCLYAVTLALYFIFDHVPINYRPVLMEGVLEPSYPSSHTLLALVVFISAAVQRQRFSNKRGLSFTGIVCLLLAALCVASRLLSGVHWLTDIIGAVLLAAALLEYYMELRDLIARKFSLRKEE